MRTVTGMCVGWALLALGCLGALPGGAIARSRTGTLVVIITGLPSAEHPAATLTGPRTHRKLTRDRVLFHLPVGRYRIALHLVRITRRDGAIHVGAVAQPGAAKTVRVRIGKGSTLTAGYEAVVNPGLVRIPGGVLATTGPADNPSSLTFAGHRALHVSDVLSLGPSALLPHGLFKRVSSLSFAGGRTTVRLAAVSVFDVVPIAQFQNAPLKVGSATGAADAWRAPLDGGCDRSLGGASGVYRTVKDMSISGGWNTASVLGVHIPIGVRLTTDFDLTAGIDDLAGAQIGASCELDIAFNGMAGPVPVTGEVFCDVHASVASGVGFQAQVGAHVAASASTVGGPQRSSGLRR